MSEVAISSSDNVKVALVGSVVGKQCNNGIFTSENSVLLSQNHNSLECDDVDINISANHGDVPHIHANPVQCDLEKTMIVTNDKLVVNIEACNGTQIVLCTDKLCAEIAEHMKNEVQLALTPKLCQGAVQLSPIPSSCNVINSADSVRLTDCCSEKVMTLRDKIECGLVDYEIDKHSRVDRPETAQNVVRPRLHNNESDRVDQSIVSDGMKIVCANAVNISSSEDVSRMSNIDQSCLGNAVVSLPSVALDTVSRTELVAVANTNTDTTVTKTDTTVTKTDTIVTNTDTTFTNTDTTVSNTDTTVTNTDSAVANTDIDLESELIAELESEFSSSSETPKSPRNGFKSTNDDELARHQSRYQALEVRLRHSVEARKQLESELLASERKLEAAVASSASELKAVEETADQVCVNICSGKCTHVGLHQ